MSASPGVEGAIVMDANTGVLLEAELPDRHASVVAPLLTVLMDAAHRAALELGRGSLRRVVVEGDFGPLLVMEDSQDRILAVLGQQNLSLGRLLDDGESLRAQFLSEPRVAL
ncbi:MAG: roadblock/LC7 domain-containing protein [Myxococcota bacterium]